jgi:hypothetical protein
MKTITYNNLTLDEIDQRFKDIYRHLDYISALASVLQHISMLEGSGIVIDYISLGKIYEIILNHVHEIMECICDYMTAITEPKSTPTT